MSEQWYYSRENKQFGPVSLERLQDMARRKALRPDDLVWTASMSNWSPAGSVARLSFPPRDIPLAAATLGYEAPDMASPTVTPAAIHLLRQTKPWVRLISLLMFIGGGLVLVTGAFTMLMQLSRGVHMNGVAMVSFLFQICGVMIYVVPAFHLHRYAGRIDVLTHTRRSEDLELALGHQKSFWMFTGILALVGAGLMGLILLILLLA